MPQFTHLHLHSEYSLLDGGNRMDRLLDQVKQLGMDSVAVTDHGNLYGAAEFQKKAARMGRLFWFLDSILASVKNCESAVVVL